MIRLFLSLILFISITACDGDKYLGANLEVATAHNMTIVSGFVLRYDTDETVPEALVQFAYHRGERD